MSRYQCAGPCCCACGWSGRVVLWSGQVGLTCAVRQHPSRPFAGGGSSSEDHLWCRAPGQSSSCVRSSKCRSLSSTVELLRMAIARVPPPVASNTTGALVAFTTYLVSVAVKTSTLSLSSRVHKRDTQPRAGDVHLRDDVNGIHRTVSDVRPVSDVSPCTCRSWHQPSRLACPCVASGDARSTRAACGHLSRAASCDQANACLAVVGQSDPQSRDA